MKFIFGFVCALAVLASISFANTERPSPGQIYRTNLNITQTYATGVPISLSNICPEFAEAVANSCSGTTLAPTGYPGSPNAPTRVSVGTNCTATFTGYDATPTAAGFVYGPGVVIIAFQRCRNVTV